MYTDSRIAADRQADHSPRNPTIYKLPAQLARFTPLPAFYCFEPLSY